MRLRMPTQSGNVMLMAILLLFVIAVLGASAYSISSNHGQMVQRQADFEDAFHHAEQVCNRYLWLFNHDPSILDDTSKYTVTDSPTINPTKRVYTQRNTESEYYRVNVEIPYRSGSLATNYAIVKVTAWPPAHAYSKRTVQAEIVKRTFASNGLNCNSELNKSGQPVRWAKGESFYGNFHTNSTLYLGTGSSNNPVFYGPVSYVDFHGISPWSKATDTAIFRKRVTQSEKIEWPGSNTKLMEEARSGGKGFYNKGRACIMLRGDKFDIRCWDAEANTWRYNGKAYEYTVPSGHDRYPVEDKGTFRITSTGATYNSFQELRNAIPSLLLPANRVIYIGGNIPTGEYSDVYSKFARDLGNVFISGKVKGGLTIAAANDIFLTAYDPTDWKDPWAADNDVTLVFRTPSFKTFEIPTNGVKYADTSYSLMPSSTDWEYTEVTGPGKDVDYLGLIAQNDMYILHSSWPAQVSQLSGAINCDPLHLCAKSYSYGLPTLLGIVLTDSSVYSMEINGALLCVDGEFGFESYDSAFAYKGNITLFGSLSQNTTGNLSSDSILADGYERVYIQDPRMKTMSPPHFIDPADSGWQMANWSETNQHL